MLGAESFNSLIKDLRQDMNIVNSFIIYLEGIVLPSRKCLPFSKAPAKCKAVFMMERSVFNEVKDYKP